MGAPFFTIKVEKELSLDAIRALQSSLAAEGQQELVDLLEKQLAENPGQATDAPANGHGVAVSVAIKDYNGLGAVGLGGPWRE